MRTVTFIAAAASCIASSAHADVTNCSWSATSQFTYRVVHMPDLDQRRYNLPSWGSMYCVPTAAVNLFCYAANHGIPSAYPGPGNWQSQSRYADATTAIFSTGVVMGTDEETGTGGAGGLDGLNYWAGQSNALITIRLSKTGSYTPTVAKMTKLACQGWILSFAYGRYEIVGSQGGDPILDRTGGHAVTFVRSQRNDSEYFMRYRNPADDDELHSQSDFAVKHVNPVTYVGYFDDSQLRGMNAIGHPSSDGKVRIVDSYWGIRPMWGFRFVGSPNLLGGGGGTIHMMDPTPLEGSVNLTLPQIQVSSFTTLLDLAIHPDMTEALVLTRSIFVGQPTVLRSLDPMTGAMTTLPDAPTDLVELAPGREGFIYSFDQEGKLFKLGPDGAVDASIAHAPLPASICFDGVSDTLRLLSVSERRIAKYSKSLGAMENIAVPTSVPLSGDGSVRVDPTTGRSWFKTDGSALLYNVIIGGAGPIVSIITPPAISGGLQSFQFGDAGELYLMGNGSIKVMKRLANGTWAEDPTSPFHGLPGGQRMALFGSTTNEDPAIHATIGWRDIPAEELLDIGQTRLDCDADLDGDDLVNGADLGILLGKWGAVRGIADLNQDGIVNGADLGALLGAWGTCP